MQVSVRGGCPVCRCLYGGVTLCAGVCRVGLPCVQVHGSLELLCLLLLSLELFIRYKWLGLHTFLRHKRTMIKVSTCLTG